MGCPGCWRALDRAPPPRAVAPRWWGWWSMRPRWLTRSWWRSWAYPPDVRGGEEFLEAERWAIAYAPAGRDEAYSVVVDFAKKQFDLVSGMSDTLDKKADEWAKFAVAITGAILTAASTKLIAIKHPYLFGVAIAFILASVAVAIRARAPVAIITPMTIRDLLKVADLSSQPTRGQVESVAGATYHLAVEGIKQINVWKSSMINSSTVVFCVGFALLFGAIGLQPGNPGAASPPGSQAGDPARRDTAAEPGRSYTRSRSETPPPGQ